MGDVINRIPGVYWNDLDNEQHSMCIHQPISINAVYQYMKDGIPICPLGVLSHNSLNEMNLDGTYSMEVEKANSFFLVQCINHSWLNLESTIFQENSRPHRSDKLPHT